MSCTDLTPSDELSPTKSRNGQLRYLQHQIVLHKKRCLLKKRVTTAISTTSRAPHALSTIVQENLHLNNENSCVKTTFPRAETKPTGKDIEIKTIVLERDPANLHLFEAFTNLPSTPGGNATSRGPFGQINIIAYLERLIVQ